MPLCQHCQAQERTIALRARGPARDSESLSSESRASRVQHVTRNIARGDIPSHVLVRVRADQHATRNISPSQKDGMMPPSGSLSQTRSALTCPSTPVEISCLPDHCMMSEVGASWRPKGAASYSSRKFPSILRKISFILRSFSPLLR